MEVCLKARSGSDCTATGKIPLKGKFAVGNKRSSVSDTFFPGFPARLPVPEDCLHLPKYRPGHPQKNHTAKLKGFLPNPFQSVPDNRPLFFLRIFSFRTAPTRNFSPATDQVPASPMFKIRLPQDFFPIAPEIRPNFPSSRYSASLRYPAPSACSRFPASNGSLSASEIQNSFLSRNPSPPSTSFSPIFRPKIHLPDTPALPIMPLFSQLALFSTPFPHPPYSLFRAAPSPYTLSAQHQPLAPSLAPAKNSSQIPLPQNSPFHHSAPIFPPPLIFSLRQVQKKSATQRSRSQYSE